MFLSSERSDEYINFTMVRIFLFLYAITFWGNVYLDHDIFTFGYFYQLSLMLYCTL